MRFCDKLAKLRKNNNYNQEQFAEKMNVSRQAVSKWESGSSYPDMDKMIQMCKILNCTLDELLDDGIIESNKENNKINYNHYFSDFLNFITKTYNMFWSMKLKEKIKCLIELFIIFIIILITESIIYSLIYEIVLLNFNDIPIFNFVNEYIIDPLILILLIILGIVIFLHLFKIRYLDYFITIEDKEITNKIKEKPITDNFILEKAKEKIIIRDPQHSIFNFFQVLGKIILYILKFFIILFIIPVLIFTIICIALEAISIFYIKYGLIFISVAILGVLLICYLLIYFAYYFIFNKHINIKATFIIFIISLIFMGAGTGLSLVQFMNYKYEEFPTTDLVTKEEELQMKNNIIINSNYNIEYIIDNSVDDIKLQIILPKKSKYSLSKSIIDNYEIYHIYNENSILDIYSYIIENLKKHKISNYENIIQIKVIISSDNYEILQKNNEEYY